MLLLKHINMSEDNRFDRLSINIRAKTKWNKKDKDSRLKASHKYHFLFSSRNWKENDWSGDFDSLNDKQKNLIIKGELIRTYDSLPNIDKTKIKSKLQLNKFSSKWYRLTSKDKKKLLNYILSVSDG